jgi:arginine/ornithine N-succinyltransferase beta subunit
VRAAARVGETAVTITKEAADALKLSNGDAVRVSA